MERNKSEILADVLLSFISIPMLCVAASGNYVQQTCIITILTIATYLVFSLKRVKRELTRYYKQYGWKVNLSAKNCIKYIFLEIATFFGCIFLAMIMLDLIARPYSLIIVIMLVLLIVLDGVMNFLKYSFSVINE